MNLRPREEHKELSRCFRFAATSQAERIAASVAHNIGTMLPKSIMVDKKGAGSRSIREELNAQMTSVAQFGTVLTGLINRGAEVRVSSSSRCDNTSRTLARNSPVQPRHSSVVPYNKSVFSKRNPQPQKTFFKGAVEYLLASDRNSLGDKDQTLKKILDDSKVQKRYNE